MVCGCPGVELVTPEDRSLSNVIPYVEEPTLGTSEFLGRAVESLRSRRVRSTEARRLRPARAGWCSPDNCNQEL